MKPALDRTRRRHGCLTSVFRRGKERLRESPTCVREGARLHRVRRQFVVPTRTRISQATTCLPDGTCLVLRPANAHDAEAVRRMFYRLSPTTVYRRLFLPVPQ